MTHPKTTWQSTVALRLPDWVAPTASLGAPRLAAKQLYLNMLDVAFREFFVLPSSTDLTQALRHAQGLLPAALQASVALGSSIVPGQAIEEYVKEVAGEMRRTIVVGKLDAGTAKKANELVEELHANIHYGLSTEWAARAQTLTAQHELNLKQAEDAASALVTKAQHAAASFETEADKAKATVAELRESLVERAMRISVLEQDRDEALKSAAILGNELASLKNEIARVTEERAALSGKLADATSNEREAHRAHLLEKDARAQADAKLATTAERLSRAEIDLAKTRMDLTSQKNDFDKTMGVLRDEHSAAITEAKALAATALEEIRASHGEVVAGLKADIDKLNAALGNEKIDSAARMKELQNLEAGFREEIKMLKARGKQSA